MRSKLKSISLLNTPCELVQAEFGKERFDRHFHDTFLIALVLSGANAFLYRGRTVEVGVGTVCVADPGEVHDGGRAGRSWSHVNLFAPTSLIETVLGGSDAQTQAATAAGVAIDMIREAHGVGIYLEDLASETGTSRYNVVRSVNGAVGVTPMAYAPHLRIVEAKRLILAGRSIVDAAAETGFSDQAHLTRRMKRLLGVTPGRLFAD